MPPPNAHQRRISNRLNIAGAIVLAVGLSSAAVVYWTGHEPGVSSQPDEALPLLDSKADSRALEEQQGKTGVLMVKLEDELARPGPQSLVIALSTTLVALVCFRIATWFSQKCNEPPPPGQSAGNGHYHR